jgi:glycosyltransferase involved in cell wall biosynthesis
MKVVALLTDLFDGIGGIQTFNRSLTKTLGEIAEERDWTVKTLVLNDTGDSTMANLYLNPARNSYTAFHRGKSAFAAATFREAATASALIFGHVNFAPLALGLRVTRPSLRTMLAIYGIDIWGKVSLLQRFGARSIDKVLSISASTRDQAVAANGLDPEKISIIPCTLDPFYGNGHSIKSRSQLSLPKGPMILTVSRLHDTERYKNIDVLISSMKSIVRELPDAFCVVVGEGPYKTTLQDLARTLDLEDNIIFAGRVPDELLPSYYHSSDIFVLPSLKEGFGIVFLEAMYYEKPCVGVRAGGIPEVIEDGKTGYLALPSDAQALADAITRLISDNELRARMGRAAKERLDHEFSSAAFKRRLESAICQ